MEEPTAAISISDLANNYRQLVLWVGAQALFSIGGSINDFHFLAYFAFATSLGVVLYAYRTAKSIGSSSPTSWALAMLLPAINIFTLLALSSKASSVCAANGIPVGLLGPRRMP